MPDDTDDTGSGEKIALSAAELNRVTARLRRFLDQDEEDRRNGRTRETHDAKLSAAIEVGQRAVDAVNALRTETKERFAEHGTRLGFLEAAHGSVTSLIDKNHAELRTEINKVDAKLDKHVEAVGQRFDKVEQKVDNKIEKISDKVDEVEEITGQHRVGDLQGKLKGRDKLLWAIFAAVLALITTVVADLVVRAKPATSSGAGEKIEQIKP